jgi:amino acid adenylation domain-containing protein
MISDTLPDLFDRAAFRFPDQVAIESAERWITYNDFRELTNCVAHQIIDAGALPGSVIGVLSQDRFRIITAILATLKAGCAYVVLDPRIPRKRLADMAAAAAPYCYLTDFSELQTVAFIAGKHQGASPRCVLLSQFIGESRQREVPEGIEVLRGAPNVTRPGVVAGPDSLCSIYFTSGSTGTPKAIAGRLCGIDHFLRWEIDALKLGPSVRVSQILPLAFDGSLKDFVALCCGGTLCLPPDDETILDCSALALWLSRESIEVLHCVPSLFRGLINETQDTQVDFKLRYIVMAGETLLASDVRRWRDLFGDGTQLVNLYGPTETTLVKFFHFITGEDVRRGIIPIGRPMPGAKALLLDEEGRPCPAGTTGEVYISTQYRSLGYYNQPELTQERFLPNPFSGDPADVVYRTGDLARISENGAYEFIGRIDGQVKIRGIRIELGEVENIIRQHELVRDVAVIDRKDQSEVPYLCAYVVAQHELDSATLHSHVLEHLPESMAPSMYTFVAEIPRTYSGKADRGALSNLAADTHGRHDLAGPNTPIEDTLARLWREVLGIKEVGVDQNFFTIGGHSLMAMRLVSRVKDRLQVNLTLASFLDCPTITGQAIAVTAALLEQLEDEDKRCLVDEVSRMSDDALEIALGTK